MHKCVDGSTKIFIMWHSLAISGLEWKNYLFIKDEKHLWTFFRFKTSMYIFQLTLLKDFIGSFCHTWKVPNWTHFQLKNFFTNFFATTVTHLRNFYTTFNAVWSIKLKDKIILRFCEIVKVGFQEHLMFNRDYWTILNFRPSQFTTVQHLRFSINVKFYIA